MRGHAAIIGFVQKTRSDNLKITMIKLYGIKNRVTILNTEI